MIQIFFSYFYYKFQLNCLIQFFTNKFRKKKRKKISFLKDGLRFKQKKTNLNSRVSHNISYFYFELINFYYLYENYWKRFDVVLNELYFD